MTHPPMLGISVPKLKIKKGLVADIVAGIGLIITSPVVLASDVMLTDVPLAFAVWIASAIWLMARGVEFITTKQKQHED